MAKKQEKQPLFSLNSMLIDRMVLENAKAIEQQHPIKVLNQQRLPINIRFGYRVTLIDNLNIIQLSYQFVLESNAELLDPVKLFEIEISFDYLVSNYSDFRSGDKISFSQDFLDKLSGISISTTRGILSMKLAGTFMQGFILPIIIAPPVDLTTVVILANVSPELG